MYISSIERRLRMVVLDCPVSAWDEPGAKELFHAMASLKLRGYGGRYPSGVLALDSYDFFAAHLMVCEESAAGSLRPLLAYKSVSLSRAERFLSRFPAFVTLESSSAHHFAPKVQAIVDGCVARGADLSYNGGWTIDPEARADERLPPLLKELMVALGIHYQREIGVPEWITCGAPRMRTDEHFRKLGLREITGPFRQRSLSGEPAVMMHLKEYSPLALEIAARHAALWDERVRLGAAPVAEAPAAA